MLSVTMVMCGWSEAATLLRDVLKSVSTTSGVQFAIASGGMKKLEWFVGR